MEYNYTINPMPTVYNGIKYRSQLEATWACFFDLIGWGYKYEPFSLQYNMKVDGKIIKKKWTPDFILFPINDVMITINNSILVEVKPMSIFDMDDFSKYDIYRKAVDSFNGHNFKYVLCLGSGVDRNTTIIGKLHIRSGLVGGWYYYFHTHNASIDAIYAQPPTYNKVGLDDIIFDIPTTKFEEKVGGDPTWDAIDTHFIFSGQYYHVKDGCDILELQTEPFVNCYHEIWVKACEKIKQNKLNN